MRAARLHGVRDLRVEELPDPVTARGELLIRVEACGVCPTDVRKYLLGTSDGYPLNPGHEWVGRIEAVGPGVGRLGSSGTACTATPMPATRSSPRCRSSPGAWSYGPLRLPENLELERAIFVEPVRGLPSRGDRPGPSRGAASG